jgi:hypothetical protein
MSRGIRLLERDGIGSGTLSFSGSTIKYTVGGSDSIPAGTNIRLEIARIIATAEGSFTVSIKTLNSQGGTIYGPTTSGPFIIKSITSSDIADITITGSDISPSFMVRKTLNDDAAGNAAGWNPDNDDAVFRIQDDDISGPIDRIYVVATILAENPFCRVDLWRAEPAPDTPDIFIDCDGPPPEGTALHYVITKLPANVVTFISICIFISIRLTTRQIV